MNSTNLQQLVDDETKALVAIITALNKYLQKDLTSISFDERMYMVDKIKIEYGKLLDKLYSIQYNAVTLLNHENISNDEWEFNPISFLKSYCDDKSNHILRAN